jgi:hypothetical protein
MLGKACVLLEWWISHRPKLRVNLRTIHTAATNQERYWWSTRYSLRVSKACLSIG